MIAALAVGAWPASAQTVTYQFSADLPAGFRTLLFGLGTTTPVTLDLTFDLTASPVHVTAGTPMESGFVAAYDLYGYQASALLSANVVIGTATFAAGDLVDLDYPLVGFASFWSDTPLGPTPPTAMAMKFRNSFGDVYLGSTAGGAINDVNSIFLDGRLQASDDDTGALAISESPLVITAVPEPATYAAMIGLATLGAALVRRRRNRAVRAAGGA